MSQAYPTSGGWGSTAGHSERSLAATRTKQYVKNMDRIVEWSKKHPELEILPPDAGDRTSMWVAQWRYESDVPDGENQVIYRSNDPEMLMNYLDEYFEPKEKM
jgi:hypothetical protein